MIALLQRVSRASVDVVQPDGTRERVAQIGAGWLVLLGVAQTDQRATAVAMAAKLAHLRGFEDAAGKMNASALELGRELLVVSQFTLLGDTRRGRRPSFERAAAPALAEELYELCVQELRQLGLAVQTGRFRTTMEVELLNDGPVSLIVEMGPSASSSQIDAS